MAVPFSQYRAYREYNEGIDSIVRSMYNMGWSGEQAEDFFEMALYADRLNEWGWWDNMKSGYRMAMATNFTAELQKLQAMATKFGQKLTSTQGFQQAASKVQQLQSALKSMEGDAAMATQQARVHAAGGGTPWVQPADGTGPQADANQQQSGASSTATTATPTPGSPPAPGATNPATPSRGTAGSPPVPGASSTPSPGTPGSPPAPGATNPATTATPSRGTAGAAQSSQPQSAGNGATVPPPPGEKPLPPPNSLSNLASGGIRGGPGEREIPGLSGYKSKADAAAEVLANGTRRSDDYAADYVNKNGPITPPAAKPKSYGRDEGEEWQGKLRHGADVNQNRDIGKDLPVPDAVSQEKNKWDDLAKSGAAPEEAPVNPGGTEDSPRQTPPISGHSPSRGGADADMVRKNEKQRLWKGRSDMKDAGGVLRKFAGDDQDKDIGEKMPEHQESKFEVYMRTRPIRRLR